MTGATPLGFFGLGLKILLAVVQGKIKNRSVRFHVYVFKISVMMYSELKLSMPFHV